MTPFAYPKPRHRRKLSPGPYTSYKSYKPHLRLEFGRQCVYCRLPDGPKGQESFGTDHYRPQHLRPDLECEYSNLFYACNACNSRKSGFWPSASQQRARQFIPNPCDHEMFAHLRYSADWVNPHSDAGRLSIEILQLNDDETKNYRRFIDGAIGAFTENLARLQRTLQLIDERIPRAAPVELPKLQKGRADTLADIATAQDGLARLTGAGPPP